MAVAAVLAIAAGPAYGQSNVVSTVAGTGSPGFTGDSGPATSAELNQPIGVTATPDGGYLIVDQGNNAVRRVFPDGTIATIAGNGTVGFSGDGGPATQAQLNAPNAAAMTADGGVLIADSQNHRVRFVTPGGTIQTVVGIGAPTYNGDGFPASSAAVNFPADVAVLPDGGYLIADNDNHRIRRVLPNGNITTVAGTGTATFGGDDGPATAAQINDPTGVAPTPDGGFVIGDKDNNRVRRVAPDGTITTIAGNGTGGFGGDGGPGPAANLEQPIGVAAAADGSIVIADRLNDRVRRVAPDGTIDTVAGTGTPGFNGDGQLGTATELNGPFHVSVDTEGDYLIADTFNHRIRLLDVAAPPPPPPPPARVPAPSALALDPPRADRTPGDPNVVTATVRNDDGSAAVNRTIRYSIKGPNDGAGTATTDARGVAQISWEGVREGTDVLSAFVDTNGDATAGAGEPTAEANVTWKLPVPVQGRRVNLEPLSGVVIITLPDGTRLGRGAHSAGATRMALEQAAQVPIGTTVDVRRGHVLMSTAAGAAGQVQQGEFYDGIYQTSQPRSGTRPITEVRLTEALTCPRRRSKATASRARSRRLWGRARGRFRTRGRHSTATVRGTTWLVKDTCTTTQTVVREGTVDVRDLVKRKTVRVKAGKRYTARARRR